MECLICLQKIKRDEQIFYGTQMVFAGPGEDDYAYSEDAEGLVGAVHMSCLESPAGANTGPCTATFDPAGEDVVQRSDALSLLD